MGPAAANNDRRKDRRSRPSPAAAPVRETSHNPAATAIALGVLIAAVLIPRLPALGTLGLMQYNWFNRVERFVDALTAGNLAETFQNPHPGVILMWVTGAVLMIARGLYGPISGPDRTWFFELAQIIWVLALMPLLFLAIRRALVVYGEPRGRSSWIALVPCVLVAIDPMVITMTRAVSLDGPVSLESALTVALFLTALRTRQLADEVLTGVAAGVTVLTKMPGLIFVFGMGLWLLVRALRDRADAHARSSLRALGVVPTALIATFVIVWPAMWVAPVDTLMKMAFTDRQAEDIRRADFKDILKSDPGARGEDALLDVILHPHRAGDANIIFGRVRAAWQYYPAVVLFKTPPMTLLLVAVGAVLFALARGRPADPTLKLFAHVMLFAGLYFVCMNIAAKKTWRYVLPLQVFLELGGGLICAVLITRALRDGRRWAAAALAGAVLLQSAHVLAHQPHFMTYYNPLAGGRAVAEQFVVVYWGEGAGEAARYMQAHAARAPLRFIAKGVVGPRVTTLLGTGQHTKDPRRAEFLVIDYRMLLQGDLVGVARRYWETQPPEHVVWLHDVPYMWIYRIDHHAPRGF